MIAESRHVSETIARPVEAVYAYASDPANLPEWAPGLATSVGNVDGQWFVDTPMGRALFTLAPRNEYGVLDHDVTLSSGTVFHNPVRVIANGEGSDIVFTVRRLPDMSDEEFARDARAVAADLGRLKRVVESRPA